MPTDKELSDALQNIAEGMNKLDDSVAKLGAGLSAVKGVLAVHMNPSAPKKALEQIETLEENFLKLDPNAAQRKKIAVVIEMIKAIEKHGGPKDA